MPERPTPIEQPPDGIYWIKIAVTDRGTLEGKIWKPTWEEPSVRWEIVRVSANVSLIGSDASYNEMFENVNTPIVAIELGPRIEPPGEEDGVLWSA